MFLRPCPHCGRTPTISPQLSEHGTIVNYIIACKRCDCMLTSVLTHLNPGPLRDAIVSHWNERIITQCPTSMKVGSPAVTLTCCPLCGGRMIFVGVNDIKHTLGHTYQSLNITCKQCNYTLFGKTNKCSCCHVQDNIKALIDVWQHRDRRVLADLSV